MSINEFKLNALRMAKKHKLIYVIIAYGGKYKTVALDGLAVDPEVITIDFVAFPGADYGRLKDLKAIE
jgi:hypothetical protein